MFFRLQGPRGESLPADLVEAAPACSFELAFFYQKALKMFNKINNIHPDLFLLLTLLLTVLLAAALLTIAVAWVFRKQSGYHVQQVNHGGVINNHHDARVNVVVVARQEIIRRLER